MWEFNISVKRDQHLYPLCTHQTGSSPCLSFSLNAAPPKPLYGLLSVKSTIPRPFPTQGLVHFNAIGLLPSPCLHLESTLHKIKGNLWPLLSLVQLYKKRKQPQKLLAQANTITIKSILCRVLQTGSSREQTLCTAI